MDFLRYIPVVIIIFISVLALILLLRLILTFLINRSYERYLAIKNVAKKVLPSRKKYLKEEEVLKRNLEIPRAHSQVKAEKRLKAARESGSYELMETNQQQEEDINDIEIVDFVKPIGFWTSMILGQKLTYLVQSAQVLNKRGKKGFWVSMIEAKDRSAGRQQGRGI
jgi:hypothetical protein